MNVLIMPTIDSICEDYGLDYNDTNEKELLEQQGLEAYHIEVNDGESFEIPQDFIGRIVRDEQIFYKNVLVDEDMDYYEKEEIQDDLPSGLYLLDQDEINLIMNIQEKLQKWAEETVREYHKIASRKDVNIAYYTQSDLSLLSEEPELMIIGINPGSYSTYQDQLENENWSYLHKEDPYDKNHLLKGNYCHEKGKPSSWDNHKKWKYWAGLKKCLSKTTLSTIMDDDSKIIVTNASFFSTEKADEIREALLKETIPYTLDLIDKTSPKHVIFLSGQKCFERLWRLSKSSKLFQFEYKHVCGNIYLGELDGKLCVGIPHPTYKTNEELNLVASVIPFLFSATNYEGIDIESICKKCAKQIKEYEERIHNKKKQIKISNLSNLIEKVISECYLEAYEEKDHRYKLNDKYGITITDRDKGYIAIRHINYDYKGYIDTQDKEVLAIKDMLKGREYNISEKVWIGTKLFSQFGNNDNDIIERICKEIKELKEEIHKI